ncbi:MAG: TadE family protein [Candidatus Phosphoribacter sp.]
MAEFVMVASLVLLLGMSVFQLGLVLHVRNTLITCAAEGARTGARADAGVADAVGRARSMIADSLSPVYAEQVSARHTVTPAGVRVLEVTVVAPIPVIGLIGPSGSMTLSGRSFEERQVSVP